MNKFRIVEQRGVFRIKMTFIKTSVRPSYVIAGFETPFGTMTARDYRPSGKWYKPDVEVLTCCSSPTYEERTILLGGDVIQDQTGNRNHLQRGCAEFDTYKKAENYIKKFYGSTGVDAIEKPEWKTV